MQRSALFIVLFSLCAIFSVALASPLPVQAIREVREAPIELIVREVPVDHDILRREVATDAESGANLPILAREHKSFEEYVQDLTGETNDARDTQDVEPRFCRTKACF